MYSKALTAVAEFTRPVIVSKRQENQQVTCGIGTFIVINDAGWALTAAHIVQDAFAAIEHGKERAAYQASVDAINADTTLSKGKKNYQINQLKRKWDWITHHSLWWAVDGVGYSAIHMNSFADIAIVKLEGNIQGLQIKQYPVFANPATPIQQGTSLCRLGFPFHDVKALFDINTGQFSIPDLPQLAMFPNDGILTRNVMLADAASGKTVHFLETSSAGLRGQSGGPIFDTEARVWALQSRTTHLPLGFAPTIKQGGKEFTEHQFMHVGWGTHVSHIRELCDQYKVGYQSA